MNNNRMERCHGTFKERTKVMRALKKEGWPFVEEQRVYYDFLRPHTALNGQRPAEAAKLDLELDENKWQGLIERSTKHQKKSSE